MPPIIFRTVLGTSPAAYRARFATVAEAAPAHAAATTRIAPPARAQGLSETPSPHPMTNPNRNDRDGPDDQPPATAAHAKIDFLPKMN